jgi:hypothetical protein
MIYVVLGMHKSGTTLVSRILDASGISMGDFRADKTYDEGNKYERRETLKSNVRLLGLSYKQRSLKIPPLVKRYADTSRSEIAKLTALIKRIQTEHEGQDWGFKDPRTCLTYDIWQYVLPEHKIIAVFRHPQELWQHYRPESTLARLKLFRRCWAIMTSWYVHNHEIRQILRKANVDAFMIEYAMLMTEDQGFANMCAFTQTQLTDCRNMKLYRSKRQSSWVMNLVLMLQKRLFGRDILGLYQELRQMEMNRDKEQVVSAMQSAWSRISARNGGKNMPASYRK